MHSSLRVPNNFSHNQCSVYEPQSAKLLTSMPFIKINQPCDTNTYILKGGDPDHLRQIVRSQDQNTISQKCQSILVNSTAYKNQSGRPNNQIKASLETPYRTRPRNNSNIEFTNHKQCKKSNENSDSYEKIMEKIKHKQKLINELKRISEIKLPTRNKISNEMQKSNRNEESFNNNKHCKSVKIDKNEDLGKLSDIEDWQTKNTSLNYLRDKAINRGSTAQHNYHKRSNSQRNNQEQSKIEVSYTPKRANIQSKYDVRCSVNVNNYKNTSFNNLLNSKNTANDSIIYISNNSYPSPLPKEIYSPTISLKNKYNYNYHNQPKSMKDVLQSSQMKSTKNSIRSNKSTTIHDFQLGNILGQGKFGTVYQAIHKQSKFLVALKKISKEVLKSNLMIDQFLLEIKIQSFCIHKNILGLYGFFDDTQFIYLILQYMEDGTLYKLLKRNKIFTEANTAVVIRQATEAINYLHMNGIAHRDIKPQNVVISHGVGKLCDFGWAAICTQRRRTYCGTFDYAAPQILQGAEYDMTVDLWCLGVLAYELLVGKAPFYHISRKETVKKIINVESAAIEFPASMSNEAVSFIDNLIRKNPLERSSAQNILKHSFLRLRE